ncbi:MAG TPA: tripartite tricarboxylate transporter substrate-binding protein [Burkholderiales bacterium]|nr:tripartite tricarboxylate transporter substrate-binding protein [Burkholderiales bacterium]
MKTGPRGSLRLILGFSPGSLSDHIAGMVSGALSAALDQHVVIELHPGQNGVTAACEVAASRADGKTLFLATLGTHALAPNLGNKSPYDPLRDFACVALIAKSPLLLACHPSMSVTSISELIGLAKSCNPALTYATSAIGGAPHLAAELFQAMTGIVMRHVRYDETQRLYGDLEAGAVSLSFNNLISMLPRCRRGVLRALAVSSAERSAVAPEIPTIAESGVRGYEVTNWVGIVAPRATPQICLDELSDAITAAVRSDAVRAALLAAGVTPCGGTPQFFASFMASEVERWRAIASRLQPAR